jgi:hypothetical protein
MLVCSTWRPERTAGRRNVFSMALRPRRGFLRLQRIEQRDKQMSIETARVDTAGRIAIDGAAVRSAAAEIFKSNRARARELSCEATPLGAELRRLFDRERSLRSSP